MHRSSCCDLLTCMNNYGYKMSLLIKLNWSQASLSSTLIPCCIHMSTQLYSAHKLCQHKRPAPSISDAYILKFQTFAGTPGKRWHYKRWSHTKTTHEINHTGLAGSKTSANIKYLSQNLTASEYLKMSSGSYDGSLLPRDLCFIYLTASSWVRLPHIIIHSES
jgi:hypothetical protein